MSHQVVVSLGSNEQRERHLLQAFDVLEGTFGELLFSPVYESLPAKPGDDTAASYYNLVLSFCTDMPLDLLSQTLKRIELECGRDRSHSLVAIDIDLLLWDDYIGECGNGVLPHRDIEHFAYTLRPLADLLPEQRHPQSGKTFADLWMDFCQEDNDNGSLTPVDFVWRDQVISVSAPCLII